MTWYFYEKSRETGLEFGVFKKEKKKKENRNTHTTAPVNQRYVLSIWSLTLVSTLSIDFFFFSFFKYSKFQSHFPWLFIEMPFHSQCNIIAVYSVRRPNKCHCNKLDIFPLNLYEVSDRQYGIDWFVNNIQCDFCALTFCVFSIQILMGFAPLIPMWSLSSLVWFCWVFLDVLIHFCVSDVGSHLHSLLVWMVFPQEL